MLFLVLSGCSGGSPVPAEVPDGAVHVGLHDGSLRVADEPVATRAALERAPFQPTHAPLGAVLPGSGPAWVSVAPEVPFLALRKLVRTVEAAGHDPLLVSPGSRDRAFRWAEPARFRLQEGCPDGAVEVVGVEPRVTLSIQSDPSASWIVAWVGFLPRTSAGPVAGLSESCLRRPACEDLFRSDPGAAAACREVGDSGPDARVQLGGSSGCVVPLARQGDFARWPEHVAAFVRSLELGRRPLLLVVSEAEAPAGALDAVFTGFREAGARTPAVETALLHEANEQAPACTAPVRTAHALTLAGARWAGSLTLQEP